MSSWQTVRIHSLCPNPLKKKRCFHRHFSRHKSWQAQWNETGNVFLSHTHTRRALSAHSYPNNHFVAGWCGLPDKANGVSALLASAHFSVRFGVFACKIGPRAALPSLPEPKRKTIDFSFETQLCNNVAGSMRLQTVPEETFEAVSKKPSATTAAMCAINFLPISR